MHTALENNGHCIALAVSELSAVAFTMTANETEPRATVVEAQAEFLRVRSLRDPTFFLVLFLSFFLPSHTLTNYSLSFFFISFLYQFFFPFLCRTNVIFQIASVLLLRLQSGPEREFTDPIYVVLEMVSWVPDMYFFVFLYFLCKPIVHI